MARYQQDNRHIAHQQPCGRKVQKKLMIQLQLKKWILCITPHPANRHLHGCCIIKRFWDPYPRLTTTSIYTEWRRDAMLTYHIATSMVVGQSIQRNWLIIPNNIYMNFVQYCLLLHSWISNMYHFIHNIIILQFHHHCTCFRFATLIPNSCKKYFNRNTL